MNNSTSTSAASWPILLISTSTLFLCLLGMYGNIISAMIYSSRCMRSSINILLTGLSFMDFSMLLLCIPAFVIPAFDQYSKIVYWDKIYPFVVCYVYPLVMTVQTAAVWTFVLISVERFVAVCRPFDVLKTINDKKAYLALATVITLSFLYNVVRFWEYGIETDYGTNNSSTLSVSRKLRDDSTYFNFYLTGSYFVFNFFWPFSIIAVLNIKIVLTIKRSGKHAKRLARTFTRSANSSTNQKREFKTAQMMLLVTVMFGMFNTPAYILNIWEAFERNFYENHELLAYVVQDLSNFLIVTNSATTVLVYIVYCRRFRQFFFYYHRSRFCGVARYAAPLSRVTFRRQAQVLMYSNEGDEVTGTSTLLKSSYLRFTTTAKL